MGKREPFLTQTLNARTKRRKIERLIGQGWEQLPARVGDMWNPKVVLRKPNPRFKG